MFLEKIFINNALNIIEPQGVCGNCDYNSSAHSLSVEPNKTKESSYMTRYNIMRYVENQGKGCPT